MKKFQRLTIVLVCCTALFTACKDDDDAYNMYDNWQARNTQYYANVADTARRAIAAAQAAYGSAWEDHCDWRMYRSTLLGTSGTTGATTDSICVHIETRGTGSGCPLWSDTVRVNYRGWFIPATDENGETVQTVFDQSYFGTFNAATAVPRKMGVTPCVSTSYGTVYENTVGLSTAMQYMHIGDTWTVYVPHNLGYGTTDITLSTQKVEYRIPLSTGGYGSVYAKEDIHSYNMTVPAYSLLKFKVNLSAYYRSGIVVPSWR